MWSKSLVLPTYVKRLTASVKNWPQNILNSTSITFKLLHLCRIHENTVLHVCVHTQEAKITLKNLEIWWKQIS